MGNTKGTGRRVSPGSKAIALPKKVLGRMRLVVLSYNDLGRREVFDLIRQIRTETGMLLADIEAYHIYMAVKRTQKVKGDIAEVGVFQGGSAKLICEAKGQRALYLFDTFEGLPTVKKIDETSFKTGQFIYPEDRIKRYLKKYPKVSIHKGFFPDTGGPIKDKTFSFVHLDVDIYQSTKDSLEFFYPRMARGGIIISHDYINVEGVRKAIDEFFKDKPEPIIELPGSQCLIVKT